MGFGDFGFRGILDLRNFGAAGVCDHLQSHVSIGKWEESAEDNRPARWEAIFVHRRYLNEVPTTDFPRLGNTSLYPLEPRGIRGIFLSPSSCPAIFFLATR